MSLQKPPEEPESVVGRPSHLDIVTLLREVVSPVLIVLIHPMELDGLRIDWRSPGRIDEAEVSTQDELVLELLVKGEAVFLPLWTIGEPTLTLEAQRRRLASDLQDFVAESEFGWGQLRAHGF